MRQVIGLISVLLVWASASEAQPPGTGRVQNGGPGHQATLYNTLPPEKATREQILALTARIGPGVVNRGGNGSLLLYGGWGTGSDADLAAAHLVKIGSPAIPYILPLITMKDEAARALVIEVLSRIKDRRSLPALIGAVKADPSVRVRISAAEGLAWSIFPDAVAALVPALRDSNRQVQMYAVRTLTQHPRASAVAGLADLMRRASEQNEPYMSDTTPAMVAAWAAGALGKIGAPAYRQICELMDSPDAAVRQVAECALTECADRRAIPKLQQMCASPDDTNSRRAAFALSRWPDPDSANALTRMMNEQRGCTLTVLLSLARMGGPGLGPLFAAASDPNPALRHDAADALLDIRDRSAAERLVTISSSDDPQVAQKALLLLSIWKDARGIPATILMVASMDMNTRQLAVGMLGPFDAARNPEIIPPLLTAMTDPSEGVRGQAASALMYKKDRHIVPAMNRLVASQIPGLPALARMVLQYIGKPRPARRRF